MSFPQENEGEEEEDVSSEGGDWVTVDTSDEDVQEALRLERQKALQKKKKGGRGKVGRSSSSSAAAVSGSGNNSASTTRSLASGDFIPMNADTGDLDLMRAVHKWKEAKPEKGDEEEEDGSGVEDGGNMIVDGVEVEGEEEKEESDGKGHEGEGDSDDSDVESSDEDEDKVMTEMGFPAHSGEVATEEDSHSTSTGVSSTTSRADISRVCTFCTGDEGEYPLQT